MKEKGRMQEQSIALVTGSSAQISTSQGKAFGIEVLPFTIQMNGKVYSEGIDIEPSEVYKAMRTNADALPTTAPPSVGAIQQKFEELFAQGFHDIIYLALSSKLSGEYSTALSVAEALSQKYPDRAIHVVDSTVIATPQYFLTLRVAEQIKQGKSISEILQWLEGAKKRAGVVGSLETLDFLAKGGRIGKAAHLLGSLLDIVPILAVKEGEVAPLTIKRGSKGLCNTILKTVQEIIKGYQKLDIAVMHADAPSKAAELQSVAKDAFHKENIPIHDITIIMGIHVGPGAFGLGYLYE